MVSDFLLTLWTADLDLASEADLAEIDRIGVDLETLGKAERQSGRPTWISPHTLDDLRALRRTVSRARLFVRCNAMGPHSADEVEAVLRAGAEIVMLPNFVALDEVARFAGLIGGRARLVPLVERIAACEAIAGFPGLGIEEIHVGLNDLSIDLGAANRLTVLAHPLLDDLAGEARRAGIRFCVGGVAAPDDTGLPVPADLVYAQHARLGSTGALIARSFFRGAGPRTALKARIAHLRARIAWWRAAPAAELERARQALLRFGDRAA